MLLPLASPSRLLLLLTILLWLLLLTILLLSLLLVVASISERSLVTITNLIGREFLLQWFFFIIKIQ
jgi:hypothetical protein